MEDSALSGRIRLATEVENILLHKGTLVVFGIIETLIVLVAAPSYVVHIFITFSAQVPTSTFIGKVKNMALAFADVETRVKLRSACYQVLLLSPYKHWYACISPAIID